MKQEIKKRGRPKSEPTYTKSFRVKKDVYDFLNNLKEQNNFVINLIKNSNEYKHYINLLTTAENQNKPYKQLNF